ncbi:TlpA family protein disulfide reductase [bacterium 1XD8-76]|nr:TlpA family protein disulfide reductase [bacterium 1XD8-76]
MVLLLNALLLTACGGTGENADRQNTPETEKTASSEQSAEDDSVSYLPLSVGDAAPDFTAVLTDGTEFTLSEQQGKVVLLNFWATWCGPCVREMPAFEKLYGEYGEDVAILAVNCMESEDIVKAFQDENGYTFPIACDPEGDVSLKYPSQGIPYTLVIDEEGIIQNIYVGAADAETQYLEYKGAIDAVSEGE